MAALLASLIAAGGLLWLAGDRRAARYAAAVFPTALVSLLVVIYAGNLVTQRWLGASFTHTLARLWLQDVWKGRQLLAQWSAGAIATMLVTALIALLLELLIWAWALRGWKLQLRTYPASVAALMLVAGSVPSPGVDPIIAFVRGDTVDLDVRQRMIFDQLRRDEPLRRAAYGQHAFERRNVIV